MRAGFIIDTKGGNGSHIKAIWPQNQKVIVIQQRLQKQTLSYVLKEIEQVTGVTWDDLRKYL